LFSSIYRYCMYTVWWK